MDWPALTSGPQLLRDQHPWLRERGVDAIVLHHRGQSPRRPDWVNHGRLTRDIATDGVELLQALPAVEGSSAVPVEQGLVHGSTQQVWLPPGRYVLRGLHGADHTAWQRSLVIEQT